MSRWVFDHATAARLSELELDLEPGQEFDAPDDWKPEPYPHPIYREVTKPAPKAPKE